MKYVSKEYTDDLMDALIYSCENYEKQMLGNWSCIPNSYYKFKKYEPKSMTMSDDYHKIEMQKKLLHDSLHKQLLHEILKIKTNKTEAIGMRKGNFVAKVAEIKDGKLRIKEIYPENVIEVIEDERTFVTDVNGEPIKVENVVELFQDTTDDSIDFIEEIIPAVEVIDTRKEWIEAKLNYEELFLNKACGFIEDEIEFNRNLRAISDIIKENGYSNCVEYKLKWQ